MIKSLINLFHHPQAIPHPPAPLVGHALVDVIPVIGYVVVLESPPRELVKSAAWTDLPQLPCVITDSQGGFNL